jgi:hypothetical protein
LAGAAFFAVAISNLLDQGEDTPSGHTVMRPDRPFVNP